MISGNVILRREPVKQPRLRLLTWPRHWHQSPKSSGKLNQRQKALSSRLLKQNRLNSVIAAAIREIARIDEVAHAVDMTRFIKPDPSPGPGLAISHLFTQSPAGAFWDNAHAVHTQLLNDLTAGRAADLLLTLPEALMQGTVAYRSAEATIRRPPGALVKTRADAGLKGTTITGRWVVSAARGGGFVVGAASNSQRLMLIGGLRETDVDGVAVCLTEQAETR